MFSEGLRINYPVLNHFPYCFLLHLVFSVGPVSSDPTALASSSLKTPLLDSAFSSRGTLHSFFLFTEELLAGEVLFHRHLSLSILTPGTLASQVPRHRHHWWALSPNAG